MLSLKQKWRTFKSYKEISSFLFRIDLMNAWVLFVCGWVGVKGVFGVTKFYSRFCPPEMDFLNCY